MASIFKKSKDRTRIINQYDMLLMVEKGITGEMQCIMQYIDMQQQITNI